MTISILLAGMIGRAGLWQPTILKPGVDDLPHLSAGRRASSARSRVEKFMTLSFSSLRQWADRVDLIL